MYRKLICALLCLLLTASLGLTCFASQLPIIVDDAQLLSSEQVDALAQKADDLRQKYAMDIVILTVDSLDGASAMVYAEDYYDYSGYGIDDQRSGTLFLLAMEEREWYIDTSGNAIYALTDYALLEMENLILPYLRDGDYYGAFDAWLDGLDGYFAAYANGSPVDGFVPEEDKYHGHDETVYPYEDEYDTWSVSVNWMISILVGLAAAGITILIMRSAMNTKRREDSAGVYMKPGSYDLRIRRDVFLYSQVSKTRKESSSGSSSGSSRRGGGSSVHRSSSGRSHGGRGGKF